LHLIQHFAAEVFEVLHKPAQFDRIDNCLRHESVPRKRAGERLQKSLKSIISCLPQFGTHLMRKRNKLPCFRRRKRRNLSA
jgi:hypothetical protein